MIFQIIFKFAWATINLALGIVLVAVAAIDLGKYSKEVGTYMYMLTSK